MQDNFFIPFENEKVLEAVKTSLNNPFGSKIPRLALKASKRLQDLILVGLEPHYKFGLNGEVGKGKMFGVLVVQNSAQELGYLATFSGNIDNYPSQIPFVPSVFDASTEDYYINKGMRELTEISNEIKGFLAADEKKRTSLVAKRRAKSHELQQWLFNQYYFQNKKGTTLKLGTIFQNSVQKQPPAGAGECAAPKLLNYAFVHGMKPIAIAEFWYGKSPKSEERKHLEFYPACKNKCRPILEFMLDDTTLFNAVHSKEV